MMKGWYATMLADPKVQIKFDTTDKLGHAFPARLTAPPEERAAALGARAEEVGGASPEVEYSGASECLAHMYGDLKPRARAGPTSTRFPMLSGKVVLFDQTNFTKMAKGAGWADAGLVYIPATCGSGGSSSSSSNLGAGSCSLHVIMHDCGTRDAPKLPPPTEMSADEQTYASVADANSIVLLMPRLQADAKQPAADVRRGCWDVFGQLGKDYARQSSPHLHPLLPMIQTISSGGSDGSAEESSRSSSRSSRIHRQKDDPSTTGRVQTQHHPVALGTEEAPPLKLLQLPRIRIDPDQIFSNGHSSGGDMAVQFHVGFSKHVKGVCGYDAQPWRCAATMFEGDVMLPQTPESSTPHCIGCPAGKTILYDHCKSHAHYVNSTLLAAAAADTPSCTGEDGACIDAVRNLESAKIFLTRGECRTYTGSAVANTRDVYAALGAKGMKYFDQCNPDGSHKKNDTIAMCLEHVFGPSDNTSEWKLAHNYIFEQAPYVTDYNVGFAKYGFVYMPSKCLDNSTVCGIQVSFHGCGTSSPPDPESMAYAESNGIVLLHPNVPGEDADGVWRGNNATEHCNAGSAAQGNCKEISRGCWDGYGQLSDKYYMQNAPHMQTVARMIGRLSGLALVSEPGASNKAAPVRSTPTPSYVHPGIMVSRGQLDAMRADVQAKRDPTYSAFLATMSTPIRCDNITHLNCNTSLGSLSYMPHPTASVEGNTAAAWPEKEDSGAAYTHALLWYATQDERHAKKSIEIMDAWATTFKNQSDATGKSAGLVAGWTGAVWPRAGEIIKHTAPRRLWPNASIARFERMLTGIYLPLVERGSDTNGNWGLAMTEAAFHIGIFTDNATVVDRALKLWKVQAPAYLYISSDGPYPKRPPIERRWPKTWPNCGPNCTDAEMVTFWHGQSSFLSHDGLCQETCRDLGHTQMGIATLGNVAETAYHQGWDLWGDNRARIVAAAEFHASLMSDAPPQVYQPPPDWLTCAGAAGRQYPLGKGIVGSNGSTFEVIHHHFHTRLGLPMPNVSALLPAIRPLKCWDHMCWETLTHGGAWPA